MEEVGGPQPLAACEHPVGEDISHKSVRNAIAVLNQFGNGPSPPTPLPERERGEER